MRFGAADTALTVAHGLTFGNKIYVALVITYSVLFWDAVVTLAFCMMRLPQWAGRPPKWVGHCPFVIYVVYNVVARNMLNDCRPWVSGNRWAPTHLINI